MSMENSSPDLIGVNMPDTDILSSHKLCDLVDKILPSAFGTMIQNKQKDKKHQKLRKKQNPA